MIINRLQKTKIVLVGIIYLLITSCTSVDLYSRSPNSKTVEKENQNEISIVTYNIKAIYDKEPNEVDSLIAFIHKDNFDFVVFQELFDESTRDEIVEKSENNYQTIISRVDYNSFPEFLFQDAGLFMMSKYPLVDLSSTDFEDDINNSNGVIHKVLEKEWSKTNDFLANKSVVGALFDVDDSTQVFLFATHVQAIGTLEHKLFQLDQIFSFINSGVEGAVNSGKVNDSKELVVLLAGDFNSNAYSPERYAVFKSHLGYPRDLHKEFHGAKEEYTFAFRSRKPSRRFDYILSYDTIQKYNFRKVDVKSIAVHDVKVDSVSISDHIALKAKLIIN
jgi:endonuclease/exonuclease/phosphatase family metal-dependent hydrolase